MECHALFLSAGKLFSPDVSSNPVLRPSTCAWDPHADTSYGSHRLGEVQRGRRESTGPGHFNFLLEPIRLFGTSLLGRFFARQNDASRIRYKGSLRHKPGPFTDKLAQSNLPRRFFGTSGALE
jgi:hypothetical protein